MANPSSFFKAIAPGTGQDNLKIPLAYGSQMEHLPREVVLRDRYGNRWEVEVTRTGDQWIFDKGWPQLYQDNSVVPGDFFVFERRSGVHLFDFRIFKLSGAEKKGVGALTRKSREEEETNRSNNKADGDDADGDEDDGDADDGDGDDDDDDGDGEDDSDDDDYDEICDCASDDEDSDEIDEAEGGRKRKGSAEAKKAVGKQRRRRHTSTGYQGEEIFKRGLASRPKNPFFVSRSRNEERQSELQIPRDMIKDYKLKLPKKLYVVDENGNKWEALTKTWKDGRMVLSKGWRSLCRVNHISWDDPCICEFVRVAGELELLVRRV